MGIESQYLGEINIPEEHRAEYAQQALKLLRAGGMVTVEPVQLYGHKLYLLSLPELDEEGKAVGHYNYLDENGGERWCLNAKEGWFGCGKIIGSCYYSTIAAVHILTTLWSTSYAATLIDGCLVREKLYIRWINYVLGTQYTNHRATQLWEIGKLLQLDNGYWVHRNPDLGYLLEDYPPECADRDQTLAYLATYHFDELCSILPPLTDEDWEELKQSKMLTIQAIYDQLQSTLREYHQNGGTLEGVKKFLIMLTEEKRQMIHQYLAIDGAMHAGFYEGQGSIGHETGTSVRIRCPKSKLEGLKLATRRTQVNFRQLMAYLEEETAYTYAPLLVSGQIKISIQVGDEEMPRRLAALEPGWDGTPALVPEFMTDLGGGPVTIRCRYGTIQPDKKADIYYKGNMASSGLEIRFNGRCIEHGLYASINDFIVEKQETAGRRT